MRGGGDDFSDEFAVDVDEMEATIAEMQRVEQALEVVTREVELEMAQLHGLWHGDAARAHMLAQAEWQRGLAEMRAALTAQRLEARLAHENYLEAATVNARMWAQIRC
jgi:WXG100 family type VII secretion target